MRKKNKSKPKSPGLFMMEDDEDAKVHDDNIIGGSFGYRSTAKSK